MQIHKLFIIFWLWLACTITGCFSSKNSQKLQSIYARKVTYQVILPKEAQSITRINISLDHDRVELMPLDAQNRPLDKKAIVGRILPAPPPPCHCQPSDKIQLKLETNSRLLLQDFENQLEIIIQLDQGMDFLEGDLLEKSLSATKL